MDGGRGEVTAPARILDGVRSSLIFSANRVEIRDWASDSSASEYWLPELKARTSRGYSIPSLSWHITERVPVEPLGWRLQLVAGTSLSPMY